MLVGVWAGGTAGDAEASMAELARLAETAGSIVLDALVQRRSHPDGATYIGSGKVQRTDRRSSRRPARTPSSVTVS